MKNRLESLDNLGSPAFVTNNSGNVIKSYRYYAFGELRAQSGAFSTDYSFTGYLKEETGAHYAKMRYYEGGIGRFLRVDPLGALNPYVYCNNDPLNFVDPWGLDQEAWSWWTDYDNKECGSEGVEIVGSRGGGGWSYDYMDSHDDAFIYVIERNRHDVPHGGGDRYHRGGGRGGSGRGGGGGGVPYWRPRPKSVIERMIEGIENYAESFFSLEGGWNNLNFAGIGQYFIGGTFGVLWTDNSLHLELGLIAGSPGASLGLTRSTDALTPGFHSAAQIYKGLATFQSGTYIRSQSNWFEAGLGIPSTGLSGWGGVIFVTPALISW